MFAHRIEPPGTLGLQQGHLAAPLGCRHVSGVTVVEQHASCVRIQVCQGTQKKRFAAARGTRKAEAVAGCNRQIHTFDATATKSFQSKPCAH
jgi:hypothetical protein